MKQEHYGTEVTFGGSPSSMDFHDALGALQGHSVMLKSAETLADVERGVASSVRTASAESQHAELFGEDWTTKRICLVAKHDHDLLAALAGRQDEKNDVFVSDNMVNGLHDALISRDAWDVLFFKYEDFGTITSLFNFMRLFRLRCPALPLVLVSDNFQRDDFGPERLSLCDASLKLPTSVDRVEAAIKAARLNNAIWVARLDESEQKCATN